MTEVTAARAASVPPPKLPALDYICLEASLYEPFGLDRHRDGRQVFTIQKGNFQFDSHCIHCGDRSTFKTQRRYSGAVTTEVLENFEVGFFFVDLFCARRGHKYTFQFVIDGDFDFFAEKELLVLRKVGQWPSLEDIAGADIDRYRSVMTKEQFVELRRAGGLYAHGVGIGSFVYLRRLFEQLITRRLDDYRKAGGQEGELARLRMDEKIEMLAGFLPPALVKFRSTYGILSTGLHELSEEECIRYFPAVRSAVIQMLEQDWEVRERKRAEDELEKQIAEIDRSLRMRKQQKAK